MLTLTEGHKSGTLCGNHEHYTNNDLQNWHAIKLSARVSVNTNLSFVL